jgi:hypothetical protein
MNPSDTHIERMAETFAQRTPFLRRTRQEAIAAWRAALELGREAGLLGQIEQNLHEKRLADLQVQDQWDRAREYPATPKP